MNLQRASNETLFELFKRLNIDMLDRLCLLSFRAVSVCRDEYFWKQKLIYDYDFFDDNSFIPNSRLWELLDSISQFNQYSFLEKQDYDDVVIFAIEENIPSILRYIVKKKNYNLFDFILKKAAIENNLNIFIEYIDRRSNDDIIDENLYIAIDNNSIDVVKYIFENLNGRQYIDPNKIKSLKDD
jgi:hypothetical protein